ncbi:putative 60S ribosomal protein L28e [Wickerhamomyces ciferrii]|uniref:60S ribosomal protein L28e n=1 Tax=Wickerhamomyces ciferrii (strain ATCC 14091 / BCRC 22168 / CBS 111 / JCM 3599 / NBRC 0793 / NRRL Y-1031 F-60-10) TaxID=1206466 RepID=K0KLW8_WICCF|nr:putative 60S ribosomal protein L28e [Wickerhamomyces ciferrii]CCH43991.1 putative 60S ribosomal protein L28e [Wickerhamomyces ciferrii]
MSSNVSNDFIWAVTSKQSSFLVKRPNVVLSRDPLNVSGKNTKTSSGLVNQKAFGITQDKTGAITVVSKSAKNANKPAKNLIRTTYSQHKSPRRTALAVANLAKGYRDDLRAVAVKRASQYSHSKSVKKSYPTSVRGKK